MNGRDVLPMLSDLCRSCRSCQSLVHDLLGSDDAWGLWHDLGLVALYGLVAVLLDNVAALLVGLCPYARRFPWNYEDANPFLATRV